MEGNTRYILITGGTSGIGLSLVKRYLSDGCSVIINYNLGGKRASEVNSELLKNGYEGKYVFLQADVGNRSDFDKKFASLPDQVRYKIEVVINNAAILTRGSIDTLQQAEWEETLRVNTIGAINTIKIVKEHSHNLKSVVNIGSIRGIPAISRINNAAYSISKSTIPALTSVMAKTYGPDVRVNAIIPGVFNTPQRQGLSDDDIAKYGQSNAIMRRLGEVDELANLCIFLTSDEASYITGSAITIDGGYNINYVK